MKLLDLTSESHKYEYNLIFQFLTDDVAGFILLRSHLSNDEENDAWANGFKLLCQIGTGKFRLLAAVQLLDLIARLTDNEIDAVCEKMLSYTQSKSYGKLLEHSDLLRFYRTEIHQGSAVVQ